MREIKVRCRLELISDNWGKYKKGDVDSFYFIVNDEKSGLVRYPIDKRWKILNCDEYIGINDCDNNEIYENDILKFKGTEYTPKFTGIVKYNNVRFEAMDENNLHNALDFITELLEVVGNIHKNKNLLNE